MTSGSATGALLRASARLRLPRHATRGRTSPTEKPIRAYVKREAVLELKTSTGVRTTRAWVTLMRTFLASDAARLGASGKGVEAIPP